MAGNSPHCLLYVLLPFIPVGCVYRKGVAYLEGQSVPDRRGIEAFLPEKRDAANTSLLAQYGADKDHTNQREIEAQLFDGTNHVSELQRRLQN